MQVKIIDYTNKKEEPVVKFFNLAYRYKKGVYQFAKYPTKTFLFNKSDEKKFMSGEEVWIHKDEVSIKID
jgi:hypothetical protein